MPTALAVSMLTAIGCCLAAAGVLGAALGAWQLIGWVFIGGVPVVAEVWRHSGMTGTFFVAFFRWLPAILGVGIVLHLLVAWLGVGLVTRRRWAWRGAFAFGGLWALVAVIAWLVARRALQDLADVDPTRAIFAHAAEVVSSEVAILGVVLGAFLVLFLLQPAVRAQFRSGS
jgi:hypothetical protein